jgi:hypothetical protein
MYADQTTQSAMVRVDGYESGCGLAQENRTLPLEATANPLPARISQAACARSRTTCARGSLPPRLPIGSVTADSSLSRFHFFR